MGETTLPGSLRVASSFPSTNVLNASIIQHIDHIHSTVGIISIIPMNMPKTLE